MKGQTRCDYKALLAFFLKGIEVFLMSSEIRLTEDDIPNVSLRGRNIAELKVDKLKFWLKCRGDSSKGLKTKAELVKRYI